MNASVKKTHNTKRGSVLITALIFGSLLILTTTVLLKWGTNEKRINYRHQLRIHANNAAESVLEYGFAELQQRWQDQTTFTSTELSSKPLSLPGTAANFFANTEIDYDSLTLTGGQISSGSWTFIDPADPANAGDPQAGKLVFARDVQILAKATANPTAGAGQSPDINAYCTQTLQVRDAPLFSHAVFYNMLLEFHNGPVMYMYGPVHANDDIWICSDDGLYFTSTVKSASNIYHGYFDSDSHPSSHYGAAAIKNSEGIYKDMYTGGDRSSDDSYVDSRMGDDWKAAATERWGGNVASKDHDVPTLVPPGISKYIPDDLSTTSVDETENHGYAILEPQLANTDPDYKGATVQQEKYSYKAGLIIRIIDNGTADYGVKFIKYQRSDPTNPNSAPVLGADGKPVEIELDASNLPADLVVGKEYKETTTTIEEGFYDQREQQEFDEVTLDISKLRQVVDSNDTNFISDAWSDTYKVSTSGANDWNGIVYVEMPYSSSASNRTDKIKVSNNNVALKVVNGGTIPNPAASPDDGFTLATNAPMYVSGHYNADGLSSTGSATSADASSEPPASLVADSITILSPNWDANNYDNKSKDSYGGRDATFTEVSAAILTGLAPTEQGTGRISGGVHNFPRFLEDWGGKELRYRGSLVALFESEVNADPMIPGRSFYSPPNRNWGFHDLFKNGHYPPGSPRVRDFRKKDFHYMTASEYQAVVDAI